MRLTRKAAFVFGVPAFFYTAAAGEVAIACWLAANSPRKMEAQA